MSRQGRKRRNKSRGKPNAKGSSSRSTTQNSPKKSNPTSGQPTAVVEKHAAEAANGSNLISIETVETGSIVVDATAQSRAVDGISIKRSPLGQKFQQLIRSATSKATISILMVTSSIACGCFGYLSVVTNNENLELQKRVMAKEREREEESKKREVEKFNSDLRNAEINFALDDLKIRSARERENNKAAAHERVRRDFRLMRKKVPGSMTEDQIHDYKADLRDSTDFVARNEYELGANFEPYMSFFDGLDFYVNGVTSKPFDIVALKKAKGHFSRSLEFFVGSSDLPDLELLYPQNRRFKKTSWPGSEDDREYWDQEISRKSEGESDSTWVFQGVKSPDVDRIGELRETVAYLQFLLGTIDSFQDKFESSRQLFHAASLNDPGTLKYETSYALALLNIAKTRKGEGKIGRLKLAIETFDSIFRRHDYRSVNFTSDKNNHVEACLMLAEADPESREYYLSLASKEIYKLCSMQPGLAAAYVTFAETLCLNLSYRWDSMTENERLEYQQHALLMVQVACGFRFFDQFDCTSKSDFNRTFPRFVVIQDEEFTNDIWSLIKSDEKSKLFSVIRRKSNYINFKSLKVDEKM